MDSIKVFSPGSITNLSCGYDVLGVCLENRGDEIEVIKTMSKGIEIESKDSFNISNDINENVAGIAAQAMLKNIDIDFGIKIIINKGIKPGSGIGSSAASSAGTVYAINQLLNSHFDNLDLVRFSMEGENFVSGSYHADNVAPIIFGGITLVRSITDLDIIKLPSPKSLEVIIIRPNIEIKTSDSRRVVKKKVKIEKMVQQSANLGAFISSLYSEDFDLMSRSVVDEVVEPDRSMLIPEFESIKKISIESGALSCGISGSGPSMFMLSQSLDTAHKLADELRVMYSEEQLACDVYVSNINPDGAILL